MASVLAVPSLLAFFKQLVEDGLYRSTMLRIRFVEGHHVDKDNVALMHEEVAEKIKSFCLVDPVISLSVDSVEN